MKPEQTGHTPRARKQAGARQPITRHPLFPAIVALWFAALLGLGSFALRTSLLETLVTASRIDALVPPAAPPLGVTARLLLALALGVVGGVIGFLLAKRMAGARNERAPQVFKVADVDLPAPAWPDAAGEPAAIEPPVEALGPVAAMASTEIDVDGPVLVREAPEAEFPASPLDAEPIDAEPIEAEFEPEPEREPAVPTAAERIACADLAELSHVELIERLAIALQRRQELLGTDGDALPGPSGVVRFPDFADRHSARQALPAPSARPAPQETEKALREALAALQRMSSGA